MKFSLSVVGMTDSLNFDFFNFSQWTKSSFVYESVLTELIMLERSDGNYFDLLLSVWLG